MCYVILLRIYTQTCNYMHSDINIVITEGLDVHLCVTCSEYKQYTSMAYMHEQI